MKLVYFSTTPDGTARLGLQVTDGIMDVEACCRRFCLDRDMEIPALPHSPLAFLLSDAACQSLVRKAAAWASDNDARPSGMLLDMSKVTLLAPIKSPGKIVCVGHNYREHCAEQNAPIPDEPVIFAKFSSCVQDPNAPVIRPAVTQEMDFEAELGVVIGREAHCVSEEDALACVGGYLNLNDVTARDLQRRDGQWVRAKSADTFAPLGPSLVTADEITDPQNLGIQMRLNGKIMQDSNTSDMIFPVARLISHISQFASLQPGDIIATGTPPGVGGHRTPPVFLQDGDVMEVEVEGLGILRNPVQV